MTDMRALVRPSRSVQQHQALPTSPRAKNRTTASRNGTCPTRAIVENIHAIMIPIHVEISAWEVLWRPTCMRLLVTQGAYVLTCNPNSECYGVFGAHGECVTQAHPGTFALHVVHLPPPPPRAEPETWPLVCSQVSASGGPECTGSCHTTLPPSCMGTCYLSASYGADSGKHGTADIVNLLHHLQSIS